MRFLLVCLLVWFFVWGWAADLKAVMQELEDEEMIEVTAQAGISVSMEKATYYDEIGRLEIRDSYDLGSLVLEDMIISDGQGWGYEFNTLEPLDIDLVTYDASWGEWNTALRINAPSWLQEVGISVGNVIFCGQELGSLSIGQIDLPSFQYLLTTPDNDTPFDMNSGLYFKYFFQKRYDEIRFTYNDSGDALAFQGLQFAESFSGSPQNPGSWVQSGSFIIGKPQPFIALNDGHFARINIIKESNTMILDMDFPMEGSVRVQNVHFDGHDFGPVALDGINVHSMSVQFSP